MALALAGCTGGEGATPAADDPKATFTQESGGVEGRVVNAEFQPIAGVFLQIIGANRTANTTANGAFAFSDLEPIDYLMLAKHPKYVEAKVGFSVPVGNVTELTITLDPVPPPDPYADEGFTFDGQIGGAACVGPADYCATTGRGSAYPTPIQTVSLERMTIEANWRTILFEAEWTPSTDLARNLNVSLVMPNTFDNANCAYDDSFPARSAVGESGLAVRLDRSDYEEMRAADDNWCPSVGSNGKGGVYVYVFPAAGDEATAAYLQQRFTIYGTVGYNAPLAPDYSRLQ